MNYELAKQLKDAGFPQNYTDRVSHFSKIGGHGSYELYWGRMFSPPNDFEVQVPSLSELIEACVKNMPPVARPFFTLSWSKSQWHALVPSIFTDHDLGEVFNGIGDSPEESVANLWLALNKK